MVRRIVLFMLLLAGSARADQMPADSLRIVLPEMQPVVGEMIPVTLRGEYTSRIALETLSFPNSDAYDWMQLARDQWRDEQIDGRTVRVFERRLALFPRQAGTLAIGPVVHRLTLVGPDNLRAPREVTAPAVSMPVAPFPAEGTPLSAASLTLEDVLSAAPGSLRDGETLVRRVTLRARGTLPHMLPPRPALREPWLISFAAPEQREVEARADGPVARVVWEWHLRPKTGEPGVLPAVAIPWFDTAARQMRVAEIPALPFGYASFRDNGGGAARLPAGQLGAGILIVAAGAATGVAVALAGLSRRRRGELLRVLRRLSPVDPTRRHVRRAARAGDLVALRRAAERYLRRRRALGLPVSGRETAPLDAMLYARAARACASEASAAVLHHA